MSNKLDVKSDEGILNATESEDAEAEGILKDLEGLKLRNASVYENILEQLQAPGSNAVVMLAPHLIRPSRWANRHAESFKGNEFQELKEAIGVRGGNTQPIIVRAMQPGVSKKQPLSGTNEAPRFEIVSGHRRHQACRELGLPVRTLVIQQMSDLEMSEVMFDENNARVGLTPWEAGSMYKSWLDAGLYPSARSMAERLGKDISDVSRAVRLCKLPKDLIAAFETPILLQYKDADEIYKLLERDEPAVLKQAQQLAEMSPKRPRAEVLRLLKEAVFGTSVGSTNTARKTRLQYKNESVAELQWQADGCAKLHLSSPIPSTAQSRFEADVQAAIARALRSASTPTAEDKASPENEKADA